LSNSPQKDSRTQEGKWLGGVFRFLFRILDRVSLRSFRQVVVHVCIAVALAAVLYFGRFVGGAISDNDLVIILAAIAAGAGALLAVSLALGIFSSQYYTDWTYRSRERLRNQLEGLEDRMQKSARKYPGISSHLVELFMLMAMYIPGQPVEFDKVREADKVFHDWVSQELIKSGKKINFGSIDDYETFEKYAFDAHLVASESRDALTEVGLAEVYGRTLNTLPPVIATWALVLVFSLVFAIIGSSDIICGNMNLSILIVPIYLCLFAVSAVVIDCWGLMEHMRAREKGYGMGVSAFVQQHGLEKYK
jgi:hypothetical protein